MSTVVSDAPVSPKAVLSSPRSLWAAWLVSRVFVFALITVGDGAHPELGYYFRGVNGESIDEYPLPALIPLYLLKMVGASDEQSFALGFIILCLIIDALIAAYAIHLPQRGVTPETAENNRAWAALFWILFSVSATTSLYMRLDIFPAFLVGASAALLAFAPRFASVVLAFATSVKLWPGLLGAGLVGHFRKRPAWERLAAFFLSLGVIALAITALKGPERLIKPLSYQGDRGLQVESVWATPFVLIEYFNQGTYSIGFAESKSFEITGPGVDTALHLSSAATIIALVAAVAWAVYRLLRGGWTPRSATYFFLAAVAVLLATNKVFSPQYMIWIGPLLAVALVQPWGNAQPEPSNGGRKPGRSWLQPTTLIRFVAAAVVAAMALTSFVYPYTYVDIIFTLGAQWQPPLALALRNVLIVIIAVVLIAVVLIDEKESLGAHEAADDVDVDLEEEELDQAVTPEHRTANTTKLDAGVNWLAALAIAAVGTLLRLLILAIMTRKRDQKWWHELQAWDAEYYLQIAENGYFNPSMSFDEPAHFHTMAFFPGYPLLVRTVHQVTQLPYAAAAVVINFVFLVAVAAAVMALAHRMKATPLESNLAALVVTTAPMSIVFNMPYTEAMFVCFALWALVAMIDEKWVSAGVLITAASCVRLTSIDLVAAFGLIVLLKARRDWRAWAALVISAVPLAAYLSWANSHLKPKDGYFGIQEEYWNSAFDFGVASVRFVVNTLLTANDFGMIFSAVVILALPALLISTWNKLPLPVWLFCAILAANVLLSDGIMHSRPRLLLPAAVVLVPYVIAGMRSLGFNRTLPYVTVWVLFGSWYSAFMLSVFEWAI